jgi:hypothetical protein
MIRIAIVLLIAVLGLSSALLYEKAQHRIKLQDATITSLQDTKKITDEALDQERKWSASRETVISGLLQIGVDIKLMQGQIADQDLATRNAMKELLKNDKAVRDYMALSVPANLGVLYERKATNDPTQYGSSGSVRPNPVQIPKSGGTKNK